MPVLFVQHSHTTSGRILPRLCGMAAKTASTSQTPSGSMTQAWPSAPNFNPQQAAGLLVGTVE